MKKLISILLIACTMMFAGCSGFSFEITQFGSNTEVKIKDADDGKYAESNWFSVGKNEKAVIESLLDQGAVDIEFVQVDVFTHADSEDEVIPGETLNSVKITDAKGTITATIPQGDYILRITTVGKTSGSFTVKFE